MSDNLSKNASKAVGLGFTTGGMESYKVEES